MRPILVLIYRRAVLVFIRANWLFRLLVRSLYHRLQPPLLVH
nr:MAG TPA: hypothetical protein [Caudoviricetes sp.]